MAWTHGLSDYQVPRSTGSSCINYILKYITKNHTSKTIWKKLLTGNSVNTANNQTSGPDPQPSSHSACASNPTNAVTKCILSNTTNLIRHPSGAKFCTWSRKFNFSLFTKTHLREPCLTSASIHNQTQLTP